MKKSSPFHWGLFLFSSMNRKIRERSVETHMKSEFTPEPEKIVGNLKSFGMA
jgi:hypothetical protein